MSWAGKLAVYLAGHLAGESVAVLAAAKVELKVGDFEPEFVGKMQFYLTALDKTVRLPDENPPIGIITP